MEKGDEFEVDGVDLCVGIVVRSGTRVVEEA